MKDYRYMFLSTTATICLLISNSVFCEPITNVQKEIEQILRFKFPEVRLEKSDLPGFYYRLSDNQGVSADITVVALPADIDGDGNDELILCLGKHKPGEFRWTYDLSIFKREDQKYNESLVHQFSGEPHSVPKNLRVADFTGRGRKELNVVWSEVSAGNRGGVSKDVTYLFDLTPPIKQMVALVTEERQWYDETESVQKTEMNFEDVDGDGIKEIVTYRQGDKRKPKQNAIYRLQSGVYVEAHAH